MRSSERAPEKSEPELASLRLPLQPMRRVEAEAEGSVMVALRARTSAPSRKADSG